MTGKKHIVNKNKSREAQANKFNNFTNEYSESTE